MKELKIDLSMYKGKVREVLSAAIQEKAFELGYEWNSGKEVFHKTSPYLFLGNKITHISDEDESYFKRHSGIEISADDFLDFNPEEDFKPFDKVLVRDFDSEVWGLDFFERKNRNEPYTYHCIKSFYHQCIPYEGNEHLLGTTGEPIVS